MAEFWRLTRDPKFGWDPDDIAVGPTVIVIPLPDAHRYTQRYSEPDKIAFGMGDEANWPVRFWDIDAAMAAMLMLLAAVEEDLGGVVLRDHARGARAPGSFRGALALSTDRDLRVRLSVADEEPSGSWMKRRRRPLEEQVHRNGW